MRVAIFTDHFYHSKRQASLHWLAQGILANHHEVSFISTPLSAFSVLKSDYRLPLLKERRGEEQLRMERHEGFNFFGPQRLRVDALDRLYWALILRHVTGAWARKATRGKEFDAILIESGYSIGYYPMLRQLFPHAAFVYYVPDDPRTIGLPTNYVEIDRRLEVECDGVYLASPGLTDRYPRGKVIDNSPDVASFAVSDISPYGTDGPNIVSVGTMLFDEEAVVAAAQLLPDVNFHLIGPAQKVRAPSNVNYLGEMPFADTLAYLKHAHVGLAPYRDAPGVEYIAVSSLKVKQYKYFELPVVCPIFAALPEIGYFPYTASDPQSLASAIVAAMNSKERPKKVAFTGWKERAARVLGHEPFVS